MSRYPLSTLPSATVEATWQESAEERLLEITTDIQSSARRAKIVLTLPTQMGDPLFVTQYVGLSEAALQDLIRCIIPFENLKKRFDVDPRIYDQLIDNILNESLPLFALKSFFSSAWDKLKWETWDEHDRLVLSVLQSAPDMIEEVDELLSLRGKMTATVTLKKASTCLLSEAGTISAKVLLGSQEIKCDTLISPEVRKAFLIAHKKAEKPAGEQEKEEKSSIRLRRK